MTQALIIFNNLPPWVVQYEADAEMTRMARKLIAQALYVPAGMIELADPNAEETEVYLHLRIGDPEPKPVGKVRFVHGGEPGTIGRIRYVQAGDPNPHTGLMKVEVHFPSGHIETLELAPDVAEHCANRAGTYVERAAA